MTARKGRGGWAPTNGAFLLRVAPSTPGDSLELYICSAPCSHRSCANAPRPCQRDAIASGWRHGASPERPSTGQPPNSSCHAPTCRTRPSSGWTFRHLLLERVSATVTADGGEDSTSQETG